MSNIEKIRQEIERLYDGEAPKHDQQCEFEDGYFTGIATISKFIDSLPEEKATCKTCGFYENNCPFIRGKLIPYPNKVCKDYTYSAMKEQEKPSEDLEGKQMIKELKERIVGLDNNGNPIAVAPPDIPMIVEKVNEIIRYLNATQRK